MESYLGKPYRTTAYWRYCVKVDPVTLDQEQGRSAGAPYRLTVSTSGRSDDAMIRRAA
jgi:hypothetical protein